MLYLLFLSLGIFAKQLDLSAQFNELDSWKYLTKFAVGVGNANWELNITVADPDTSSTEKIKLSLIIYLDDQLEEIASIDDCPRKIASAKKVQNFTVPLAGESTNIKGTFTQKTRPHVWYYALADCKGTSKGHKLLVNIHLTGTDDSEFSIEEEGFIYLYPAVAIIFLISLSQNLLRMIQKFRKEDKFEPVSLFLNLAIFCDFAGIICKIIHL